MKSPKVYLLLLCSLLIIVTYSNCTKPGSFSTLGNTSTIGNPLAPTTNKIVKDVCAVIQRCHPQVTIESCQSSIATTRGFDVPFALPSAYSSINAIIEAEAGGALSAINSLSNNCSSAIQSLTCDSTEVAMAYQANMADPYVAAPNMIPSNQCGQILTPSMNLIVPIELTDKGLSSNTSTTAFARTQTSFNPNDYDGTIEYSFEIAASNTDTSARMVNLIDANNATIATISVPPGISEATRLATILSTPLNQSVLKLQLEGTSSAELLNVYAAKLFIKQTGASKTKIYIPLIGGYPGETFTSDDTTAAAEWGGSVDYQQGNPHYHSLWRKNLAAFNEIAVNSPWHYEVVLATTDSGGIAYSSLYNNSLNLPISETELSTTSLTPTLLGVDFENSASNFNDLQEMDARVRRDIAVSGTGLLYKAGLWLKLTKLAHAEIYHRLATTLWSYGSNAHATNYSPLLLNLAAYPTGAKVYNEVAGYITETGTPCTQHLFDIGSQDSGLVGAIVPESQLNFSTTTKTLLRSAALALNSGNRFGVWTDDTHASGACVFSDNRIVIGF